MTVSNNLILKIADTDAELRAAQRLRYRVFVQEMGAKVCVDNQELELERDVFDPHFDHLILIDADRKDPSENVVGVYRLMRGDMAETGLGFYGQDEYDLTKLMQSSRRVMELGRSCIDPLYRGGLALQMMWNGLGQYVLDHDIEILFGVASFAGTDTANIQHALSFLHHNHLAPEDLRVTALPSNRVEMDILPKDQIDRLKAVGQLPPLIKAYLRLGGFVGQGAFVDHSFNTTDVCLIMDTQRMSAKHKAMYEKGTN